MTESQENANTADETSEMSDILRSKLEAAQSDDARDVEKSWPIEGKAGEILAHLEPGEPIFVLRARDILSTMTIRHYASLIEDYVFMGGDQLKSVVKAANAFAEWQRQNPGKVHLPD